MSVIFSVAVCDDDLRQAAIILELLNKYQADRPGTELCSFTFTSGEALLSAMNTGGVFDLFLLDVLMPGLDGIELAKEIRLVSRDAPMVFLTSSADYALDAFRVNAAQYILKPVGEAELFCVLDKVTAALRREEEGFFLLAMPERTVKIPFYSIVCVELAGRALKVFHENGSILHSKSIRSKFEAAVSPLLSDGRFLSTHKSFILNMARVEELRGDSFVMEHGLKVPVPRYRYAEAKKKYFAWLSECGNGIAGGKR